MKHAKINLILMATAFICFIFAPSVKSIFKPEYAQENFEQRRLEAFPEIPDSWSDIKSYPEAFESYYKDHFGFRPTWVSQYRNLKNSVHDPVVDKVIFGTESGWLFFNDKKGNDVIGDYRNINQFSEHSLNQFINNIKLKQAWLAKQNIEYLFIIAPSKHYVYPEYLPSKYQPIAKINLKQQLADELKKHPDINYIDLTQTLIDGKKERQMYLKNDTHWTDYATNLVQFKIATTIENIFPKKIKPNTKPWGDFNSTINHTGDLSIMNGTTTQFKETRTLPAFKQCAETPLQEKKKYNDTFDTNCDGHIQALVFRDSFFSNLQPFVSEYLGLSRFVWEPMTFKAAEKHINDTHPDIVIEEWVDRFLPKLRPPK